MFLCSQMKRLSYSGSLVTSLLLVRTSSICFSTSCQTPSTSTSSNSNSNTTITNNLKNKLLISDSSIKGRRSYMEDEFYTSNDQYYNAVFDGHGGARLSEFAKLNAYSHFTTLLDSTTTTTTTTDNNNKDRNLDSEEIAKILTQSLLNVDEHSSKYPFSQEQGSTACVVYLNKELKNADSLVEGETSIVTANVGDSRAVLSRNKVAIDLSIDHKPDLPSEKARIESLGGFIRFDGCARVNGNLALSRSLGDNYMKPYVIPLAETTITKLTPEDEFIIIGTDGLWDVFTSEIAVKIVHQILESYKQLPKEYESFSEEEKVQFQKIQITQIQSVREKMANILTDLAYKLQSYDNITVLVIWLK